MVRLYISRHELYPEENKTDAILQQQVCVIVDRVFYKEVTYHETSRTNKLLIEEDKITSGKTIKDIVRLNFFVSSNDLALKLANRWVKENSSNEVCYKVHGIDKNWSIFD